MFFSGPKEVFKRNKVYYGSAEPLATFKMYEGKLYVECLYSSLILGRRRSFRAPSQLICFYMYKILTWISNLCKSLRGLF